MPCADPQKPLNLQQIRDEFPALKARQNGRPYLYADSAATALKPRAVIRAMRAYLEKETANAGRGLYRASEKIAESVEKIRKKTADFVGSKDASEIIFTRGTTDSVNLLARSLGETLARGDEILATDLEHHSNFVPWKILETTRGIRLRSVPVSLSGEWDYRKPGKLLSKKTRLFALTALSNVTGHSPDLKKTIDLAHSKKVPVFLDAAQAVAHFPLRLSHLSADYAAFSGHKLYGPTGIGVLYGRKALLEKLPIVIGGGGSVEKAGLEGTVFRKPPYCFEPGTLPLAEIVGLGAALDFLNEVGWKKIAAWEKSLSECLAAGLEKISGLTVVGKLKRDTPLFSFTLAGVHPHDLAAFLDSRGVAIRAGHHCAGPLHRSLGLAATARISLSFFNTEAECARICAAIREAQKFFSGKGS